MKARDAGEPLRSFEHQPAPAPFREKNDAARGWMRRLEGGEVPRWRPTSFGWRSRTRCVVRFVRESCPKRTLLVRSRASLCSRSARARSARSCRRRVRARAHWGCLGPRRVLRGARGRGRRRPRYSGSPPRAGRDEGIADRVTTAASRGVRATRPAVQLRVR